MNGDLRARISSSFVVSPNVNGPPSLYQRSPHWRTSSGPVPLYISSSLLSEDEDNHISSSMGMTKLASQPPPFAPPIDQL